MADHVVAVGPKLSEAFGSYLWSVKVLEFTAGVFEEFAAVKQIPDGRQKRAVLVFRLLIWKTLVLCLLGHQMESAKK